MNTPHPNTITNNTIRRATYGDQRAFGQIVEAHSQHVFRLAYRLTAEEAAAEDVVQETFLKVYRKLKDFRFQSSFHTWLHRITVNTAMDYLRRKRHLEVTTESGDLPHAPPQTENLCIAERAEVQARTQSLMRQLSPLERSALNLRHFEGYSIREIAQLLELGESACKQAIFRAVKKLRLALEPWS